MKNAFTILELIVVTIILGILATVGTVQYTTVVERSRGAEAKLVLGNILTQAKLLWLEKASTTNIHVSGIRTRAPALWLTSSVAPTAHSGTFNSGGIRTQAPTIWFACAFMGPTVPPGTFSNDTLGIGNNPNQIPGCPCTNTVPSSHYFFCYNVLQNAWNGGFNATATRCTGNNGKQPGGPASSTLTLDANLGAGSNVWGGTGNY